MIGLVTENCGGYARRLRGLCEEEKSNCKVGTRWVRQKYTILLIPLTVLSGFVWVYVHACVFVCLCLCLCVDVGRGGGRDRDRERVKIWNILSSDFHPPGFVQPWTFPHHLCVCLSLSLSLYLYLCVFVFVFVISWWSLVLSSFQPCMICWIRRSNHENIDV